MITFSEKAGVLTFKVRVAPRASRSEIVGEHNGALRVRVAAPPVDDSANQELVRTLAKAFRVSPYNIEITSGHRSKLKHVSINGGSPALLTALASLKQ